MSETRFLIIDGNSIGCRGAFVQPVMTTSFGRETGGTYRFFTMLDRVMKQIRPTHVLVAWDVAGANFRTMIDESYKGTRSPKSDSLYNQFHDIKSILSAVGIKHVGVFGYEADDVIGTYATISKADKNYIFTGDKDSFQLINDNTKVIFPHTGTTDIKVMDRDEFKKEFEIEVEQFIELKALMGDGSDNIKGVEKCGKKTAIKWIKEYGSIEGLIKNAHAVKGKAGENLRAWIPESNKTLELVTIRRDVPVDYTFEECEIDLDWLKAEEIFRDLEFNSLIGKLKKGGFYNVEK